MSLLGTWLPSTLPGYLTKMYIDLTVKKWTTLVSRIFPDTGGITSISQDIKSAKFWCRRVLFWIAQASMITVKNNSNECFYSFFPKKLFSRYLQWREENYSDFCLKRSNPSLLRPISQTLCWLNPHLLSWSIFYGFVYPSLIDISLEVNLSP